MIVKIYETRECEPRILTVSNQHENNTRELEFDISNVDRKYVEIGNPYLLVSKEGNTYPFPIINNKVILDASITGVSGDLYMNYVIYNGKLDPNGKIDKEHTSFISDTFKGVVTPNQINVDYLSKQPLPTPLQIVYDDLLKIKKELDDSISNGAFIGPKGDPGPQGIPGEATDEFKQLVEQSTLNATKSEQSATQAKQ